MKAIETRYAGYRFRSRLEARWAVFFGELGIKYLYEPEGYRFEDGTTYLPDFYLPDSKQYFEVKGVLSDKDEHKIKSLIAAGEKVAVGYDEFEFTYNSTDPETKYLSFLIKCHRCGKYYFTNADDRKCPACGHRIEAVELHFYTVGERFGKYGTELEVQEAIIKAKEARFEKEERQ